MKRFLLVILAITLTLSGLSAREVYTLNNSWRFFFKDENSSDNARYIRLPHTWNTDALSEGGSLRQTMAYYRRTLFVPQDWQGKRLFLHFGGVMSVAQVFVNGELIGSHHGGRTAFTMEITNSVHYNTDNTLLVEVSNAYRGDVLPTSTVENLYGGIYRDVELIVTESTTVSPLYYGTDGVLVHPTKVTTESVEGNVSIALLGKKDALCNVTLDVVSPDGYVADTKSVKAKIDGKLLSIPFIVDNPELWSVHHPALYRVDIVVGNDTVSVATGFRKIDITPEKQFAINNKRVEVRGVNLYHDKGVVGNALSKNDYKHIFNTVSDMGANAIRSVSGPHSQSLYEECDKNGILVWIDSPLVQSEFLSDIAYYSSDVFESNGKEQFKEIILQNINHPSVAMWGVFSLLKGRSAKLLNYVKELNALAKSLDPSRPTVACSNQDGDINFITDLIVWQQNLGWENGVFEDLDLWQGALKSNWSHLAQAVCYGESRAKALYGNHVGSYSYPQRVSESWQTAFHEGYITRIDKELFWGVWVNSLFDLGAVRYSGGIINSGVVGFDHNQKRDTYYLYRTLWNCKNPTLHIVSKNREVRAKNSQVIKVYSSKGVPTLTINGDTIALHNRSQGIFVTDSLVMSGQNNVIVQAEELRDSTTFTIGNYLRRK